MGMNLWKVSQIARENFVLGAASRDEEVSKLQEQLVYANKCEKNKREDRDQLRNLLRPFAALLQEHNCNGPDNQPIFQINDAVITLGDLRRASEAMEPKEQVK